MKVGNKEIGVWRLNMWWGERVWKSGLELNSSSYHKLAVCCGASHLTFLALKSLLGGIPFRRKFSNYKMRYYNNQSTGFAWSSYIFIKHYKFEYKGFIWWLCHFQRSQLTMAFEEPFSEHFFNYPTSKYVAKYLVLYKHT